MQQGRVKVSEVCRRFEVSRKTVYTRLARAQAKQPNLQSRFVDALPPRKSPRAKGKRQLRQNPSIPWGPESGNGVQSGIILGTIFC